MMVCLLFTPQLATAARGQISSLAPGSARATSAPLSRQCKRSRRACSCHSGRGGACSPLTTLRMGGRGRLEKKVPIRKALPLAFALQCNGVSQ